MLCYLVFEEFPNAQLVDVDAMAGAGVRQEDVLEEGQLLGQQLDPLLQLLVLLQKEYRYRIIEYGRI
jgi:hypothetical protein